MSNILFGTNRQFTLERLPFSIEGAYLSVYQSITDKNLYFSLCRSEDAGLARPNPIRIIPMFEGDELPFIYECDAAKLTVSTKYGTAEFTYEAADIMRIRVRGITLRFDYVPLMHEGGVERFPGEVEIAFNLLGKLLFKHISGNMTNTAKWNFRQVSPYPFVIDVSPEGDNHGEIAIHEYYSNGVANESYIPFDAAYEKTLAAFEKYCENYPEVPIQYRDMAERAIWVVWQSRLGPEGGQKGLKDVAVYMHKLFLIRAFGWQQCFHAMALADNAKEAVRLLLTLFHYQDKEGGIPDNASDLAQYNYISTKPPLYGFACCYMLDNFDTSGLTEDDYTQLYDKLSRFTNWWFKHHDHAKTGYPSYYHPDESGYDEATLFEGGLPIQSPDLLAYIVMLCEACSRLAEKLEDTVNAEFWMAESTRVLDYLVNDLWDGKQFRAKLVATGEYFECGSVALLQAAMLGKRLPRDILHTIALRISDPNEFLTDYGIATENLQSPFHAQRSFTRGPVVAPTNALILLGLFDGGETEIARTICVRYLNALLAEGLALAVSPFRKEPASGDDIVKMNTGMSVSFPFTSWAASIFLALASKI